MKRVLIMIVSIVLLFLLVSCNAGQEEQDIKDSQSQSETESSSEVQKETYTVTFDSDGGTAIESQQIEEGDKVFIPEVPTKSATQTEEYEFIGWFIGDVEWNFNKNTVSKDITLKAKWKVQKYSEDLPIRK